MPRTARIGYPGSVLHVISRFAGGRWVLDKRGARERYLQLLERGLGRTDARLLAYCLMSNHVHLVVVQGHEPAERLTKSVHTGFAGWVNGHKRKGQGPVFAGRPRIVVVEQEAYLLQLIRYVHNNPVRAGVVRYARMSEWSSHAAYVGRVEAPQWLSMGYVLERFGKSSRSRAERFDEFVNEGRGEGRRADLSGDGSAEAIAKARSALGDGFYVSDPILGSAKFARKVQRDVERVQQTLDQAWTDRGRGRPERPALGDIVDHVCRHLELEPWEFESQPKRRGPARARRLITWLWVHHYGGKQVEVARTLKASTGSVASWYGNAVANAASMDEDGEAIIQRLKRRRGKKAAPSQAVRFHVDVDE